ncbi:MAG: hypothetical protein RL885_25100 [Planctomycetota bacterium]
MLRQVAKTKKVDPDEFLAQHRQHWEPPDGLQHVWEMFCRLSGRRRMGWSAPEPIGYLEIEAFARLHGLRLSPWQIDLIARLDSEFLKHHGSRGTRTQNQLDPSGDGGEAPRRARAIGKAH